MLFAPWVLSFKTLVGGASGDIVSDLKPRLSPAADIHLTGSEGFVNGTIRWSALDQPTIAAVVSVATENDVSETIKYANSQGLPILTKGGGHGTNKYIAGAKNATYIWNRGMRDITLAPDGRSATIQAGAEAGEVIQRLWDAGKQTTTTACDCAGFMGPELGGGHGWLQGRYGLVVDNILSARLALVDGRLITVSHEENTELFWGLRGAGHNFGVVTSLQYRIYDREPQTDKWAYVQYVFAKEKVEQVFEVVNRLMVPRDGFEPPVELTHFARVTWVEEVDPDNPVILLWVIYQATDVPSTYTDPLEALSPLSTTSAIVDLPGLNAVAGGAYNTPVCGHGAAAMLFPVGAERYDTAALSRAIDVLATAPAWLRGSALFLEGYSSAGVRAVPEASTAVPDRGDVLLFALAVFYSPGDTGGIAMAEAEAEATRWAESVRAALVQGVGGRLRAYVNYARGTEGVEAVYGSESWRLEKLRALKSEWDPEGRFSFYNPIV